MSRQNMKYLVAILFYVFLSIHTFANMDSLALYYLDKYTETQNESDTLSSLYLDSAMYCANELGTCLTKATVYNKYAVNHLKHGDMGVAHAYFLKAIDEYKLHPNTDDRIAVCYYEIAIDYANSRDTVGLNWVANELNMLHNKHPENRKITYDYTSIQNVAYSIKFDMDSSNVTLRDSSLYYGKQALKVVKEMTPAQWKEHRIVPIWNYYNVALNYFLYGDETDLDSVTHYIDLAEQMAYHEIISDEIRTEGLISIYDLQANVYAVRKDYKRALSKCHDTQLLLDEIDKVSPNSIVNERVELYLLMREIYEAQHDYKNALKYEKLHNAHSRELYDIERTAELHDLKTKYEVKDKEDVIKHLEQVNEQSRKMLISLITIASTCGLIMIMFIFMLRMRKKNIEQHLYEAALLADNKQMEVDYLRKKQKEYESIISQNTQQNQPAIVTSAELTQKMLLEMLSSTHFAGHSDFVHRVKHLAAHEVEKLYAAATTGLSLTEKKYLFCFLAGVKLELVAELFNVEKASVYTVRYRMKRKFPQEISF